MTYYKIIYSQKAFSHLNGIYRYLLTESLDLRIANKIVKKIQNAVKSLKTFPFRHQKAETYFGKLTDIRQFVISNYAILYSVDEINKTIHIMGIVNCKQGRVINQEYKKGANAPFLYFLNNSTNSLLVQFGAPYVSLAYFKPYKQSSSVNEFVHSLANMTS